MKRILLMLLSVAVASGVGGWPAARATFARHEAARTQQVEAESRAFLERLPRRFAEIVKTADRITVETAYTRSKGLPGDERIEIHEAPWQLELSRALGAARYESTAPLLGLFFPLVHVYKDGREVLLYQDAGLVSCYERDGAVLFRMDSQTAAAIDRELLSQRPTGE